MIPINKIACGVALSFTCCSSFLSAATSQVTMSALNNAVKDNSGVALTSGDSVVNGDGTLMELGYFLGDTATFSGDWVPLTGPNSNNPSFVTTMGDLTAQNGSTPIPDGLFSIDVLLLDSSNDLPTVGAQFAVRFYDDTTRAESDFYNTATSSNWIFKAPADVPPVTLVDFDSSANVPAWEDASNPFKTSLDVVPEPSSFALLGLGGLAFLLRRRR